MAQDVIGGKADRKQIRDRAGSKFFISDEFARQLELVVIGKGRGGYQIVEAWFLSGLRNSAAQNFSAIIFPFLVQILFRTLAVIEV